MKRLSNFRLRRKDAGSGVEYGLMAGLVALAAIFSVSTLGDRISGNFSEVVGFLPGVGEGTKTPGDPEAHEWSFPSVSDAEVVEQVDSSPRRVTGLDAPAPIAISGLSAGAIGAEYRILPGDWTDAPGTVEDEDTVAVRITPGPEFLTTYSAVLTIGTTEHPFSVTTRAPNTTPIGFGDFDEVIGFDPNRTKSSNIQEVTGLEAPAPISISGLGASYRINDTGSWTSEPGYVEDGDTVRVMLNQIKEFSTSYTATVTIGGAEGGFTVTTRDPIEPDGYVDFETVTEADPWSVVRSNLQTINGPEASYRVSRGNMDGGGFDEFLFRILDSNGNEVHPWTTGTLGVTIKAGQQIQAQLKTAIPFSQPPGPPQEAYMAIKVGDATRYFRATNRQASDEPVDFSDFPIRTGVEPSAFVISEPQTIVTEKPSLWATTPCNCAHDFRINGGEWIQDGPVRNGDVIEVRLQASPYFDEEITRDIKIGTTTRSFTARTRPAIVVPTGLSDFAPATELNPGDLAISELQLVGGIEAFTPISISGEGARYVVYNANGTTWRSATSAPETVPAGGSVRVQLRASDDYGATVRATLTIGGVDVHFDATTRAHP